MNFGFAVALCLIFIPSSAAQEESPLPEPVFGEKTFLPEIVPIYITKTADGNGNISLSVELIYTTDCLISWVVAGGNGNAMGEERLYIKDSIPSSYVLNLKIPSETLKLSKEENFSEELEGAEDERREEASSFLLYQNHLDIRFETDTVSEAVGLSISLEEDEEQEAGSFPRFPEMGELQQEEYLIQPGERTKVSLDMLFTEQNRLVVVGVIYNWTSNELFRTVWETHYEDGSEPDVHKIVHGDAGDDFEDKVSMEISPSFYNSAMIKRLVVDVPTNNDDVSGVYRIVAQNIVDELGLDLLSASSLEQTFLFQRREQEHGPLPEGVLSFTGGTYSQQYCTVGTKCIVLCHVLGMDIDNIELKHKNAGGVMETVANQLVQVGHFEARTWLTVDSEDPMWTGTYRCDVTAGEKTAEKDIDVSFTGA